MANAQILILLAGAVPADTIRTVVEAAARANHFTPSAWTYAQGTDTGLRDTSTPDGRVGTFSTGPFLGKTFSTSTPFLPAASPTAPNTAQVPWTAFRMNLLNGPDRSPGGDETSQALYAIASAIRAGLSNVIALASRGASNTVAWDRGVPAAITLPEAGGGGSGGLLIGLALVAGVAVMAGRGTSRQHAAMAGVKPKKRSRR
jgi:hypothetical protein